MWKERLKKTVIKRIAATKIFYAAFEGSSSNRKLATGSGEECCSHLDHSNGSSLYHGLIIFLGRKIFRPESGCIWRGITRLTQKSDPTIERKRIRYLLIDIRCFFINGTNAFRTLKEINLGITKGICITPKTAKAMIVDIAGPIGPNLKIKK